MFAKIISWFKNHPILAFFLLTFLFAWGIWLPVGLVAPAALAPATLLGAWSPTLSALLLTALSGGKAGLKQFLAKAFRWRVGIVWYLVAVFSTAAIAFTALGLHILLGGSAPQISLPAGIPREGFIFFVPLIFLVNIFAGGPLAEDIGWRGYILPKICARTSTLSAALVIGAVWVIWHLPFFLLPGGGQVVGNTPLLWFSLLTIAWSVLFAWTYVNTESIWIPVLFHAAVNTTLGSLGILGQAGGEMRVLIIYTALTWLFVFLIVIISGKNLVHFRHIRGHPEYNKDASGNR